MDSTRAIDVQGLTKSYGEVRALDGIGFAVLLISVSSTLLGLLIAVSVSEVFEAQTFSSFFRFPMLFLLLVERTGASRRIDNQKVQRKNHPHLITTHRPSSTRSRATASDRCSRATKAGRHCRHIDRVGPLFYISAYDEVTSSERRN